MQRLFVGSILVLFAAIPALGQGPSATVSDLAWMTGRYSNGSLEENWATPDAGSIAALVRSTNNGALAMIELIVVEEEGDSLTLRVKQWNPGMEPRSEDFQTMRLVEVGDQKVAFEATSEGGMQSLGYSLTGDQFTISVGTAQGSFDIPLTRQSAH
jgi:hypothetical protein